MQRLPIFLFISLYIHPIQAAPKMRLDTLVWSFDTAAAAIYCGDDRLDTIVADDSVMTYLRTNPIYWRTAGKRYTLPDSLFVGTAIVPTRLMVDRKFLAQGFANRWLKTNREKLRASVGFVKSPFLTTTVMLLNRCVQELKDGTEIRFDHQERPKFVAWSLNEHFINARQDMAKLTAAGDSLDRFLKNCPDTANAFYSYKRLFQIVVLLDNALKNSAKYCMALETADKKRQDEISTINLWINDVLQSEMIAIETFCFNNVPAVKAYCYEDLIAYIVNAEKRGMVQLSLDDFGKIRLKRGEGDQKR
jgi:hypothetical protein